MSADRRARLAPVFDRYAAECRSRGETLVSLLADDAVSLDVQAVILHSHSLAGSGATMGAEKLSQDARQLEETAKRLQEAGRGPDAAEQKAMAALAASCLEQAKGFDAATMLDAFIAKMFAGS